MAFVKILEPEKLNDLHDPLNLLEQLIARLAFLVRIQLTFFLKKQTDKAHLSFRYSYKNSLKS